MTSAAASPRPLRGTSVLRGINRLVPVGRHLHPVLSLFNSAHGLVGIPLAGYELVYPAAWSKYATDLLLEGENIVPEFRALRPLCEQLREGVLVDLGANVGVYTLLMRAASKLPIIAYEPQPFLFHLLQQTIAHNPLPQVEARNLACGDTRGEIPFYPGINGAVAFSTDARGVTTQENPELSSADVDCAAQATRAGDSVIKVPVVTLDEDLANTPVSLLKIDCEGFEYQILRGARRLLEEQRPHLFLELHPVGIRRYGGTVEELLSWLEPHYDLEYWDFNHVRYDSKLMRSMMKHRGTEGRRLNGTDEVRPLACGATPRRTPIHILGRPKARSASARAR